MILLSNAEHSSASILVVRAHVPQQILVDTLDLLKRFDHRSAEVQREVVAIVVAGSVPAVFALMLRL